MDKKKLLKVIVYILTAIAAAITTVYGLNSCSAVRTVTTESTYYQKGDTSTSIITKTVESYTGEKR